MELPANGIPAAKTSMTTLSIILGPPKRGQDCVVGARVVTLGSKT